MNTDDGTAAQGRKISLASPSFLCNPKEGTTREEPQSMCRDGIFPLGIQQSRRRNGIFPLGIRQFRQRNGIFPLRILQSRRRNGIFPLGIAIPRTIGMEEVKCGRSRGRSAQITREVRLEYAAEFTTNDGKRLPDRMDYAIFDATGQTPILVIEAKPLGADVRARSPQLARYMSQLPALRFGIITDGCEYLFYGDLARPNVMDESHHNVGFP